MSTYPARPPFFAQKFIRMLVKTCAANELGTDVFVLLVTIAVTEDAKRYSGPVTFFNGQLAPIVGIRKWKTMDRIRQRAIDAGLLHYEPATSGNRLPGRYWVIWPESFDGLNDSPVDEPPALNGYGWGEGETENSDNPPPQRDMVGGTLEDTLGGNYQTIPFPKRESHSDSYPPLSELVTKWNQIPGVCHCRKVTGNRQSAYESRCRDEGWLAEVDSAIERVHSSAFLKGENKRGWKATFDWFLEKNSLTKILEGHYDGRSANGTTSPDYQILSPPE